ncbi:DUF4956 domain-containing protein [uncultured Ruthenibacterium sp.]|uniref:DUF4956 domain-containing protein n=1 Tax=uncultured Ruthenibacterium sp. TaxID=1905347 RepID=UPI00349EE126
MNKQEILEFFYQNSEELTPVLVLVVLCAALAAAAVIYLTYRFTTEPTVYSQSFNVGNVVLVLLTTVIMLMISSNIVISLGMVGALSIVRFRTAVKDARDTLYIFWSMVTGLSVGTQNFVLSGLSVCFIAAVLFAFRLANQRSGRGTLIVRGTALDVPALEKALAGRTLHFRLQTSFAGQGHSECVYTVFLPRKLPAADFAGELRGVAGVEQANWIRE